MNRENLGRMSDYIRTISQEQFSMIDYRSGQQETIECDSVGCIIGHCTILDLPENIPIRTYFHGGGNSKLFDIWSTRFTGLESHSKEWLWCFAYYWKYSDDTPEGASKRIDYLLDNGLPKNWYEQMHGEAPLCYND